MIDYIKELYYQETKPLHGPLDFGDIPACAHNQQVYQDCLSLLSPETAEPINNAVFCWLDSCNQASFRRGFQLGLRLMGWAACDPPATES